MLKYPLKADFAVKRKMGNILTKHSNQNLLFTCHLPPLESQVTELAPRPFILKDTPMSRCKGRKIKDFGLRQLPLKIKD